MEVLHDRPEEERGDLEIEHRLLGTLDRDRDTFVGGGVAEIAGDVREACREPREHFLVEWFARPDDRFARSLNQLIDAPVIDRHADDRAIEKLAPLQAVQRSERHHLGEVAGDAEDHEDITTRVLTHGPLISATVWLAHRSALEARAANPPRTLRGTRFQCARGGQSPA